MTATIRPRLDAKTLAMARNKDNHENFVLCYREEFGFTANAVTALYDVQMLKTCSTLSELVDEAIVNICKAVGKDTGQSVAKVAATRLKLVCFWIKHQCLTPQKIGTTLKPLVQVKFERISLLQLQKRNKGAWDLKNKEPKYSYLTLDTSSATKVFNKVKNFLARVRGMMGVLLVYVIRILLIPEDKDDDPPFGEEDTKYTSADIETTTRAPIPSKDTNYNLEYEDLEAHGPFVPSFLTDTKKVWSVLLACVGLGILSTIISWGGTRLIPCSLTYS